MKRIFLIFLCICLIVSCLTACHMQSPLIVEEKEVNTDTSGYIKLADGVSIDMINADYWIKDNYNEVIMSSSEISKFNEDNNKLISTKSGGNFSLKSIKDTISGEIVKELINSLEFPSNQDDLFVNGQKVGQEYWLNLKNNCNLNSVPDKVNVKFGFSVKRATLRQFPTNDYANVDYDDYFYDDFIMSDFMPFSPVAILHESADGLWYYIAMYGYCGWIEKENVAICPSREDWLDRQNCDSFLVVTGSEIRLSEDPYCEDLSSQIIPMGTKLPLVKYEDAPENINQRYSYGTYIVKLPVRLADGSISDEYSLIPANADVSVGYLDYTRANILKQAFKLEGQVYGWAGDFYSNDCSGIVREIFLCFGFEFPRVASQQMNVSDMKFTDVSKKSDTEKLELIKTLPAGSLLYFSGHIMIYLGYDGDDPYVISSVGSIATPDTEVGDAIQVNTVLVSSMLRTTRRSGATWLSSVTGILET